MGRKACKNAVKRMLRINIGGKRWFIWFVRSREIPADRDGDCGYAGSKPSIRIRRSLKGRRALNVLVHEVLHASRPELSEEAVTETANDIERVLWRCGYRCAKENVKKVGPICR